MEQSQQQQVPGEVQEFDTTYDPWIMDDGDWEGAIVEEFIAADQPVQEQQFYEDPVQQKQASQQQYEDPQYLEPTEEEKAMALGWVPQTQWRGDPNRWTSAADFLARSEHVVPMLKKDRERLFREVSELKQNLDEFRKYHEDDRQRTQQRAYEKAWKELKRQQKEAVESGNVEEYEAVEKQLVELHQNAPKPQPAKQAKPAQGQQPPADNLIEWQKQNKWFGNDIQLTRYAEAVSNFVHHQNPHLPIDSFEFFDAVKAEVKAKFPENKAFSNPRRKSAPTVQGGSSPTGGSKATFAGLPEDAKAEAIRLEKMGVMKRDQYVKEYSGDDDLVFRIDDF